MADLQDGVSAARSGSAPQRSHWRRAMIATAALATAAASLSAGTNTASADGACPAASSTLAKAIGTTRVIEIDTASGALFGQATKYARQPDFLAPKEVVLTFDDGPNAWITRSILDTLDAHCAKATFFPVGRMALAFPQLVRDIHMRGHTIGAHTWSHPLNLRRLPRETATAEIERGFAAISRAGGVPVAPFFRFPGLNDSEPLLGYLQSRGIATFTVDVISDDSFIADPRRLTRITIDRTVARGGGILLFHDIKASTARALPDILAGLQARGFKVVHLKAKTPLQVVATYDEEIDKRLAAVRGKSGPLPFYAGRPSAAETTGVPSITLAPVQASFAPPPRSQGTGAPQRPLHGAQGQPLSPQPAAAPVQKPSDVLRKSIYPNGTTGWATSIDRR